MKLREKLALIGFLPSNTYWGTYNSYTQDYSLSIRKTGGQFRIRLNEPKRVYTTCYDDASDPALFQELMTLLITDGYLPAIKYHRRRMLSLLVQP